MCQNFAAKTSSSSLFLCMTLALSACGDGADFGGPTGAKSNDAKPAPAPTPPATPEPAPLTTEPYKSLTWFWQCDTAKVEAPKPASEDEVVVEGVGPHEFEKEKLSGTQVLFRGRLCKPSEAPRDIVFVIDVSGSTATRDPVVGGSCGRLRAVEEVLTQLKDNDVRYAITTFDDKIVASSFGFAKDRQQLFQDIAPNGNIASVLCLAKGNTNYDAALNKAKSILQLGRPTASKEVFFLSDGEPTDGKGDGIANEMKVLGVPVQGKNIPVTIATLMLQGNDKVLREEIASKDSSGQPLHAYVEQTNELGKALKQLADNSIVSGSFKYRQIGSSKWVSLSLAKFLQAFNFELPSFTIEITDASKGIEVLYEYNDKRGKTYSSGGKLLWTKTSAKLLDE